MNRTQQSPYSLGQGPPPGRFPQRQASGTPSSPTALARQPYSPFGSAAAALSPSPAAAIPHGSSEASLDPSDFPALGSAPTSSTASSAANLLSSYASQAGQSAPGAGAAGAVGAAQQGAAGGLNGTLGSAALGGGAAGQRREFSADDFPALAGGAFGSAGQQAVGQAPGGDIAGLATGVNGLSLAAAAAAAAGRATASPGGQEQASALAALQAQQQHRANLLGSMNGARSDKQAAQQQQTWSASPQQTPNFPAGLLPNGTPTLASSASSPLPPSSTAPTTLDAPQGFRSPSAGGPPIAAAHAAQAAALFASNPLGAGASLPPPTAGVTTGEVPQTPAQQVLFSPADRYGLLGLLHTIKTSDPDLSMLALGTDLTNLGLDLSSTENLSSTFITPWTDAKTAQLLNIEPDFRMPSCYNVQPPPANTKIGNFSDETLFFIFYSQPRDVMQEMAAHELYKHNWRYHKELRLWLTKEAGTEPIQKTATYERGTYIFFDPVLWERVRKEFILEFASLETRRA